MIEPGSTREPCLACGDETASGSPFYSDRRVMEAADGTRTFVCSSCVQMASNRKRRPTLTDAELRRNISITYAGD